MSVMDMHHEAALALHRAHPVVRGFTGAALCGWCTDIPYPCSPLTGRPPTEAELHHRLVVLEEMAEYPDDDEEGFTLDYTEMGPYPGPVIEP